MRDRPTGSMPVFSILSGSLLLRSISGGAARYVSLSLIVPGLSLTFKLMCCLCDSE